MVIFNRSGMLFFLLFLISSLILFFAIMYGVNATNKRYNTADTNSNSLVDRFHSLDYMPLEVGNISLSQKLLDKKINSKIPENTVDDIDENNLTVFLDDEEKPALNSSNKNIEPTKLSSAVIRISNFPVKNGFLSSGFGMRKHPIHGIFRMHSGVDIAAKAGTNVQAMGEGTVVFAGRKSGYGFNVEIKHGNTVLTRYAHLKEIFVEVGQNVTPADVIGLVGSTGVSTGPHLHLEVALNQTEVDPTIFLSGKATVEAKPVIRRVTKASSKTPSMTTSDEVTYQDYLRSFDGLYGLVAPDPTN